MLSQSDRTVRRDSDRVANRKAIAKRSQIIAVTAPEAEAETELTTTTRGAGNTTSFRKSPREPRDAMVEALTRRIGAAS